MSETIPTPQRPTELPPEIAAKLEKRKKFPRTRRWLFNFAAALSLVLFVGNYLAWLRSAGGKIDALYTPSIANRIFGYGNDSGAIQIGVIYLPSGEFEMIQMPENAVTAAKPEQGLISFSGANQKYGDPINITGDDFEWTTGEFSTKQPRAFGKFRFVTFPNRVGGYKMVSVEIPNWFLQLLFAILPLWWLGRFALRWSEKKRMKAET